MLKSMKIHDELYEFMLHSINIMNNSSKLVEDLSKSIADENYYDEKNLKKFGISKYHNIFILEALCKTENFRKIFYFLKISEKICFLKIGISNKSFFFLYFRNIFIILIKGWFFTGPPTL